MNNAPSSVGQAFRSKKKLRQRYPCDRSRDVAPCKQRVGRDTQEFQALIATMVDTRGVAASSLSEKARGTQLYLPFDLHACIDLVLNEDSPGACFNFLFYPEEEENYIRMMIALGKHSWSEQQVERAHILLHCIASMCLSSYKRVLINFPPTVSLQMRSLSRIYKSLVVW